MSNFAPTSFRIAGDDGREYGPFNLASLTQWARLGRLTLETRGWDPRVSAWRTAAEVPEIAQMFGRRIPALEFARERDVEMSEQIIGRGYDLYLGGWLSNAWRFYWKNLRFLLGAYWSVNGLFLLLSVVPAVAVAFFARSVIAHAEGNGNSANLPPALTIVMVMALLSVEPLVRLYITAPLEANLWLVILRRVRQLPVSGGQVFRRLAFSYGEVYRVFYAAGFLLLPIALFHKKLLPGLLKGYEWIPWLLPLSWSLSVIILIAATTVFMFALPLAAERNLGWRAAIKTSCGIVRQHWFAFIWFVLIAETPLILSAVPFIVGSQLVDWGAMTKAWVAGAPLTAGIALVQDASPSTLVILCYGLGIVACLWVLMAPFARTALVFAYEGIFGDRSKQTRTASL